MQRSSGQVEGARVEQQEAFIAGGDGGEFGEADVVADCEGDFPIFWEIDECKFVTGGEDVGFSKCDFSGNVDVEEMDFSMGG